MRLAFDGASPSVTLPTGLVGRPWPVSFVQVTPLSREVKRPLPGPPLSRPQVLISSCHIPANRMRGFFGSMPMSEQPVFSSTNRVLVQVLPPSLVRNTPRSGCGPYAVPSAHANTMFGSAGSMTTRPMRPVFSSPIRVQVLPASVDLKMPSPMEMWLRIQASPVPAQTTLGSDGATASDPTDETGCWSKIGSQLMPPSRVLKMPPEALPP